MKQSPRIGVQWERQRAIELRRRYNLNNATIARRLDAHPQTVSEWLKNLRPTKGVELRK
jgi:transposase-like protein